MPVGTKAKYALHLTDRAANKVGVAGEVRSLRKGVVEIEAYSALLLHCGIVELTGCIYREPEGECELFIDRDVMIERVFRLCEMAYSRTPR